MKLLWRVAKEAKKYKGLLLLGGLCTIALTFLNLTAPNLLSQIVGIVERGADEDGVSEAVRLALMLLALYAGRVVFRFLASYIPHVAAWNLVQDIRMKVYNHIQGFSMKYFHDKQTGDLMSRVVNDTATFEALYAHIIPETVTNAVTLIGVTVILFTRNPRLALMTCIPIPFILIAGWILMKKVRPMFRQMQKALGGLNSQLKDNFSGIQEIQAFCQQENESGRVREKAKDFTFFMLRALKYSAVFHPSVEFLTSLGTVIVIGYGGFLAINDGMSLQDITAFLFYLALFYAPITSLANLVESAQSAIAGTERVLEVLDYEAEIADKPGAADLPAVKGHIVFDNVSFNYIDDVPVLENISFEAKPGQTVALVGPTGVGKTTMIQLAARFYDPVQGMIRVDGQDLRDVTQNSLRGQISMVLQDTFLFNGTISANIAYARPAASDDEIRSAARTAGIYDDIMEMPDGFKTEVGERGIRLSGGQKQRVAIARAVLRDAPILILDEATASVDMQTEAQIQKAIQNLSGSRTVIAIAHRLSTIKNADLILVLAEGKIVQRGTHDELVAQPGVYQDLCKVQEQGARLVGA
ncbi:MAG: ABC transporter ATP-binding protein/permease [Defluviitaleaceae bacterium]|nr:ABC transporter ATP-binding protein/permease [Defluviitaleaceae bacterium]MCL2835370.1 ABC transporter ATP-binding protein/permease [Defluviitaleaceae bacterium]